MDAETRRLMKEVIEKLPEGKVRKLVDFTMAYRLQAHGHCIIYEERSKKTQTPIDAEIPRKEKYKMDIIYLAIHQFIPRPTITWIEEIESVREGREDLKNGTVVMHKDVEWE
jgi:hypothetical protein